MSRRKDIAAEPAYPIGSDITTYDPVTDSQVLTVRSGITKREYFAAMAMQGLLSFGLYIPEQAVRCADTLIEALEKK